MAYYLTDGWRSCPEPSLEPEDRPAPRCPVCGSEATYFYVEDGEVVYCDECLPDEVSAWEWTREESDD